VDGKELFDFRSQLRVTRAEKVQLPPTGIAGQVAGSQKNPGNEPVSFRWVSDRALRSMEFEYLRFAKSNTNVFGGRYRLSGPPSSVGSSDRCNVGAWRSDREPLDLMPLRNCVPIACRLYLTSPASATAPAAPANPDSNRASSASGSSPFPRAARTRPA